MNRQDKAGAVSVLKELCPEVITQDVVNNNSFIDFFSQFSILYFQFKNLKEEYTKLQKRTKRQTKLSKLLVELEEHIGQWKSLSARASQIKIDLTEGISTIAMSSLSKNNLLTDCVTRASVVMNFIQRNEVVKSLRNEQTGRKKFGEMFFIIRSVTR